jgi:hypothetical protein
MSNGTLNLFRKYVAIKETVQSNMKKIKFLAVNKRSIAIILPRINLNLFV